MPFPQIKAGEVLKEIVLFEEFSGLVASCYLLQDNLPSAKIKDITDKFPFGITKELQTKKTSKDESVLKNSYLGFTPLHCSDDKTIHSLNFSFKGQLEGNCNVISKEPIYMNRIQNLLPFFQIASNFKPTS
jgi:hypothetical protein